MKCSLLVVILIKYVEDTSMQEGGGKEYMHTLDHLLNYSALLYCYVKFSLQTACLCNNTG
jgi:hypothetical protein